MTIAKKDEIILEVKGLRASYKYHTKVGGQEVYQEVEILTGIDLSVKRGEIVVVLGANGAGKTTMMHTIMGLLEHEEDGRIIEGQINFDGHAINGQPPEQITKMGAILVPQGKLLWPSLNVRSNLELGTYPVRHNLNRELRKRSFEDTFKLFPHLKERQNQVADRLSGGEAQMVAVARGFLSQPRLLLLDEPCLGLAPLMVKELMKALARLRTEFGITILLAEQNVTAALNIADRGYVLKMGEVVTEDSAKELLASDLIKEAYLGR